MPDQISIVLPKTRVTERSAFTATAYFRTRASKVADAPTTARYRIDDIGHESSVRDWTTLTVGTSISIPVTASDNAIIGSGAQETKAITVQSDYGTDTQVTETTIWKVTNIYGVT